MTLYRVTKLPSDGRSFPVYRRADSVEVNFAGALVFRDEEGYVVAAVSPSRWDSLEEVAEPDENE